MRKGKWRQTAGTRLEANRRHSDALREAIKRRYLMELVLGYHLKTHVVRRLAARYKLTEPSVVYLLQVQGVMA